MAGRKVSKKKACPQNLKINCSCGAASAPSGRKALYVQARGFEGSSIGVQANGVLLGRRRLNGTMWTHSPRITATETRGGRTIHVYVSTSRQRKGVTAVWVGSYDLQFDKIRDRFSDLRISAKHLAHWQHLP